jgi:predicted acetyltransferase
MPMQIDVTVALPEDKPTIARLLQLYEHDNSEFFGADLDPDGLYRVMDADTRFKPGWYVFLIKVEGKLAGFAIVTRHAAYIGDGETWLMDEFFVVRKYRRRGVGAYVACALFDRFPGRWEVSQWPTNLPAQAFWRTVIGRYTEGRFEEVTLNTSRIRGVVQAFNSTGNRGPSEGWYSRVSDRGQPSDVRM